MDRLTGYILVFVLHFYVFVSAHEMWRARRSLADCDCGITKDEVDSYYGDGVADSKGSKYPWMVALKSKGMLVCSAALITRSFVLTAGHCVHGEPMGENQPCQPPLKEVVPGRCLNIGDLEIAFIYKKGSLKKFYDVRDVMVHPDYTIAEGTNGEYAKNDIALIRMKGAIACAPFRKPICLPFNTNFVTTGRRAVVTGWDAPENGEKPDEKPPLTSFALTVQPQNECFKSLQNVKDDGSFCAKGLTSTCKGDSGAPLISDGEDGRFYILGVTSHLASPGCDAEHPQFFANVKRDLKWIMDIVMCCP